MNRDDLPGEDEQYAVFSALVRGMAGRPVTVRTFDLGGEKIARSLSDRVAESANPALGLRAICLSLQHCRLLDPQFGQVAHLYNPLHPAVLRLIQFAVEAALGRGMPISVCGEMAGEPRFAALLLGLGLRNLSMAPRNIPRVKQRIRSLDMVAATRRARAIMDQSDSGRIAALLDDFNTIALAH
jgi:phosphoenolpyruvate-protein kinase (PTS system EI component)